MRKWKKNILVCITTLLVCVLLAEVSVRLVAPQALWDECDKSHPDWPRPMIISDEILGWKTKPYWRGCTYQPDTNERIHIKTNSKGMLTDKQFNYNKTERLSFWCDWL